MIQLCNEAGFKASQHQVVTDDGYILNIWRIDGPLVDDKKKDYTKKKPILMQHGLEADMMQWMYASPDVSPALVLARAGYDVWMGNNRGTFYSLGHTTLSNKDKEYW